MQRTFKIAEFYERKNATASARYYYEEVVEKAVSGSDYHTRAQQKLSALSGQ